MYPWWNGPNQFFMSGWSGLFILIAVWSLFWQGLALWYAAKRNETWWFVFFLLVHTAGIVEILYLLFVVHIQLKPPKSSKKRA
jgi:hypothetical protein